LRDESTVPSFRRVLMPRQKPRRPALVVAVAAVVVVIGWAGVRAAAPAPAVPTDLAIGSLRMPTDYLLDLPGSVLVTTMPEIGRADDWFPGILGVKGTL
jgi:hypothetical protein